MFVQKCDYITHTHLFYYHTHPSKKLWGGQEIRQDQI